MSHMLAKEARLSNTIFVKSLLVENFVSGKLWAIENNDNLGLKPSKWPKFVKYRTLTTQNSIRTIRIKLLGCCLVVSTHLSHGDVVVEARKGEVLVNEDPPDLDGLLVVGLVAQDDGPESRPDVRTEIFIFNVSHASDNSATVLCLPLNWNP